MMDYKLYSEFYFEVTGYHIYPHESGRGCDVDWLDGHLVFVDEDQNCRVALNLLIWEDLHGLLVWLNEVERAIINGGTVPLFQFVEPMTFEWASYKDRNTIYLEFRTLYEDEEEHKFAHMSINSEAYRKMKRLLLRDLSRFSGSVN